jgi:hypothetical protein
MALSIVADDSSAPDASGITKSSRWRCNVFRGAADALIAALVITTDELEPHKGRREGYTVFLPDGQPCPPTRRGDWRDPGYKTIFRLDDGSYVVEVTVSKEVQAWRRKQEQAAEHEAEQERINKEIAENGGQYRNWTLRHNYGPFAETWEGTKEQLHAEGIGVGIAFPGEPGVKGDVYCNCPLGFAVRIYLPTYNRAEEAARIYTAQSAYVSRTEEPKEYIQHAPGVLKEIWTDYFPGSDFYLGTAEALVAANLVPSVGLFPGQPGRNKVRATYRRDWTHGTSSNSSSWAATIKALSKGCFTVEVPVPKAEEERREAVRTTQKDEVKQMEKVLAAERKQLRQGLEPEKTADQFRSKLAEQTEFWLRLIFRGLVCKGEGPLSFDIPEGSELWDDLAGAFQTIRDVVEGADIVCEKKVLAAAQTRLKLVAARNDKGLQSVLQNATHLRLVQSTPDAK